jgi:hypothetical protein
VKNTVKPFKVKAANVSAVQPQKASRGKPKERRVY